RWLLPKPYYADSFPVDEFSNQDNSVPIRTIAPLYWLALAGAIPVTWGGSSHEKMARNSFWIGSDRGWYPRPAAGRPPWAGHDRRQGSCGCRGGSWRFAGSASCWRSRARQDGR